VLGALGTLIAREGTSRALSGADVRTVDPLAHGDLGQVDVLRDLTDAAVADPAEADSLSLELGHQSGAGLLLPGGISGPVHGALLTSFLDDLGVQEIEAGSNGRPAQTLGFKTSAHIIGRTVAMRG
jgi:hypothetical protein